MAIEKRWIEVEDSCFGPDKKNQHWEMWIVTKRCTEYSRKTKRGISRFVRRAKEVVSFSGKFKKDVLGKLEEYMSRDNVFLKEMK